MRLTCLVVAAALVAVPSVSSAQKGDLTHQHPAVPNATVDFGIFPTGPLNGGAVPCAATGVGGPADPCAYALHRLTPEEVTVEKGGQVTFHVHGGGHGFAIYEVSKNTTRDDIGQYLCAGVDPSTLSLPALNPCNLSAANANAAHQIFDGRGNLVVVAAANVNPPPGAHPTNRVWSEPGRLMVAGGLQFINGGTTAANGELLAYRFLKTGRYLVLCINRGHLLNDWMFGFVNVTGD